VFNISHKYLNASIALPVFGRRLTDEQGCQRQKYFVLNVLKKSSSDCILFKKILLYLYSVGKVALSNEIQTF